MSAARQSTFNHLMFDAKKNVELHFANSQDADDFVNNQLRTNTTFKQFSSASDMAVVPRTCLGATQNHTGCCSVVTLSPPLFDLFVGRVQGKNVYHQLVELHEQGIGNYCADKFLSLMDPVVQSYAIRLENKAFDSAIINLASPTRRTEATTKLLAEIIKNLPSEVCDQLVFQGGAGKRYNIGFGYFAVASAELFSVFNDKLSPEVRNRAALQGNADDGQGGSVLRMLLHCQPEAVRLKFLKQLDPSVLLQAVIMSELSNDTYYNLYDSAFNKNSGSEAYKLLQDLFDKNNLVAITGSTVRDEVYGQWLQIQSLQSEIENQTSFMSNFFSTNMTITIGKNKYSIDAAQAKEFLAIINCAKEGMYLFGEALQKITSRLSITLDPSLSIASEMKMIHS
jgi:hypothetical protein